MTIRGPTAVVVLIVLSLSLAANFLVAGFVAARLANPARMDAVEQIVALGVRVFPSEIRRAIVADALRQGGGLREALARFREARQRAFQAMRAEPFDPDALDAAFADVRARTSELQAAGQKLVGTAVASASPEARARIADPGS
jgi:uncharacterized membrane protein